MAIRSFLGGVRLASHTKNQNHHIEVLSCPVSNTLYIPLQQHIGTPCQPCVEVGQRVLRGQKIGDLPQDKLGVPVHASVSGVVKEFVKLPLFNGTDGLCCVIENDGLDERCSADWKTGKVDELSPEEIVAAARHAGIVGMGGAAFPMYAKINAPEKNHIDTLVVNGAECEPFLSCDHALLLHHTKRIIIGIRATLKALGIQSAYVAIEANKKDAIKVMADALSQERQISLCQLPVKYPQGAEKQLVYAVTGRKVAPGKLPLSVGVVVQNVATIAALADALEGKACDERILTVYGDAVSKPQNILVRVGTPISSVFEACGGLMPEAAKIISGGPMMGIAQRDLASPVVKSTSGLGVLGVKSATLPEETPCILCGACSTGCPMRLMPNYLLDALHNHDAEKGKTHYATACIECGVCSYLCPARRPLVQGIRRLKAEISSAHVHKG